MANSRTANAILAVKPRKPGCWAGLWRPVSRSVQAVTGTAPKAVVRRDRGKERVGVEATSGTGAVLGEPGAAFTDPGQRADVSLDDVQLVSRFVAGLLLFGGEELLVRLRSVQQRIEAGGALAAGDVIPDDETMTEVLGYLTVGMLIRGQKRLARTVKRGMRLSMNVAGWALGTLNRATDNRLARPFREPVERRMWGLVIDGQSAIQGGRREVVVSRKLADETLEELVEEAIQALAENPELATAIQRVLAGQSASLTSTVVGSARQLSVSADDLTEEMVRRLLRRKPRQDLPPSPLVGKPLTMYVPRDPRQGPQEDGG